MAHLCFSIDSIPDLSLSKYSSLGESGVDGVLKKTSSFLRQINRKGVLSKAFFHLLYAYDPDAASGNRLKVYFFASGKDEASLRHTSELVLNSAVSDFYAMTAVERAAIEKQEYGYVAALGKREFFVEPSVIMPDDDGLKYYKVAEWEMNESARLYNMFKLMQGLNKHAAFRLDIFPVDYASSLRDVLPIQELRNRASLQVTRSAGTISANRDENAEEALKQYSDLMEKYECSPHFRANILAFSDEREIAELIVDAAGSEALSGGSYAIKVIPAKDVDGGLNVFTSMDRPVDVSGKDTENRMKFMPNLFLLDELRPFFSFPALYDGESIEIPKETAPVFNDSGIDLGKDENGRNVALPVKLLKKHAFLAGVPGSGKTNSMLHLATSLWKKHKIPFLILEPAKKEYRALSRIDGMEDLYIFSPSSGTRFPLHINPFEFPRGMSLSEHIRNLMAVFEGAFTLVAPAPFMIDNAIEAVYRGKGWYPDTINEGKLPYPTISELYDRLSEEVEKTDYEGDIKGNLRSILQVRIGSLLRREMGDVFDASESTLSPEEWLSVPALIELEAMGSGPANFLTLLLSTLIRESLKVNPNADGKSLRHVIFFEEAHNLIGPEASEATGEDADPKLAATAYVVKMLAEVRALNEGIVIADQLPTVMAPEVIKNTGLKIGHRLTAEDDRNLLGGTMSANPTQLEQMATFIPGEALVTFEGLLRPFKARICQWENGTASYEPPSNEELANIMSGKSGYKTLLLRSSQIFRAKTAALQDKISDEIAAFLRDDDSLNTRLTGLKTFLKDNNVSDADYYDDDTENPAAKKAQELALPIEMEKQRLQARLEELFAAVNESLVKIKGYLHQNKAHRKETAVSLLAMHDRREDLFNLTKNRYAACAESYAEFSKEMNGWNLKSVLEDINFTADDGK